MKKLSIFKSALVVLSVVAITSCSSGRYYSTESYIERSPAGYGYYDNDYYYPQSYPVIIDNGPYRSRGIYHDTRNYRNRYNGRPNNSGHVNPPRQSNNNYQENRQQNQVNVEKSKSRILGKKN